MLIISVNRLHAKCNNNCGLRNAVTISREGQMIEGFVGGVDKTKERRLAVLDSLWVKIDKR